MGVPSHKPLATGSDRTDCTSALPSTAMPKSWLNRPGKRRTRARRWKGRVGWRRKAGQRPALQGLEAAAQQARRGGQLRGKRKKGEVLVEHRKEGTMEGIKEQRALHIRAKRGRGAFPDWDTLYPDRQHARTFSQHNAMF
jgi:hypothetical protein